MSENHSTRNTAVPEATPLASALAYLAAGRSVLPIAAGTKQPGYFDPGRGRNVPLAKWKPYQSRYMGADTLSRLLAHGSAGVCIVTGTISGMECQGISYSLEVMDFDDPDIFDAFIEAANFQGLGDLLPRLIRERTPGMGAHLGYCCLANEGNVVLAKRPPEEGEKGPKTLIETRGQGGYCVVAPTPPGIHPDVPERGYVLTHGSWEHPPIITPEERTQLLDLARSFNSYVAPQQIHRPSGQPRAGTNGTRPGDRLNASADREWWIDLLTQHGWKLVRQRGEVLHWQRPGKDGQGASATYGKCGIYFYVFSSNAAPFKPERAYSPFSAYLLLEHGGDATQAARALAQHNGDHPPATMYVGDTTVPLLLTKDGRPRGALGNVLAVLAHDPRWHGVLGYNALNDEATFLKSPPCYPDEATSWMPRPLEDRDDAEIANWLQWQYQIFTATSTVHDAVQAAAHRKVYHPIRDYLCRLQWDKQSRIDTWLITYCHAEDTPYTRAIGTCTLIGAVARVEHPGCKMDTATFLVGEQGTRKSTTWRVLCGDDWFSDTLPDLHDKDAMQTLRGKWIVELGELATFHRNTVEIVKRYLSATQDHYRPSYGRRARTFLRQNIFVGTTNREDIFKDETGNRRFYPITTKEMCDTEALERDRDQLWAEAMHRYHQGEPWHLDPAMEAIAATVQAEHMEHDPWEESVLEYVKDFVGKRKVTTKDVMRYRFLWENPALWTPAASKRIGAILRHKGWKPSKRWNYEATPTQAASEPDPTGHHHRVAAFWKDEEPRMK